MDPNFKHKYVSVREKEIEGPTIFYLKSLTVFDYGICEEIKIDGNHLGLYSLEVLMRGLIGWDNFTYSDGSVIPFDYYNMKSISLIPYLVQLELIEEVIDICEIEQELIDEIQYVTKWSGYSSRLDENKQNSWYCENCISEKRQKSRNCYGDQLNTCDKCKEDMEFDICPKCEKKTTPKFRFRFSKVKGDLVTRCPVSLLSRRAVKLVNLVNYVDNSKSLPFPGSSLEQTQFFYSLRTVVLSSQDSLLKKEMDNMDKDKGKNNG